MIYLHLPLDCRPTTPYNGFIKSRDTNQGEAKMKINYTTTQGSEREIEIASVLCENAYKAVSGKNYRVQGDRVLIQTVSGGVRMIGHLNSVA